MTVIDGDTIEFDAQRYTLISFCTPEKYTAKCDIKYEKGKRAEVRLRELIASVLSVQLNIQPTTDKNGRRLAKLHMSDEDIGSILIHANLVRDYRSGSKSAWC